MNDTLRTQLLGWLPRQRWFGAKGRKIASIDTHEEVGLFGQGVALLPLLVTVHYSDGGRDRYQVPLSVRTEPNGELDHAFVADDGHQWLYDAPHDAGAAQVLLALIRDEGALGALRAHRLAEVGSDLHPRLVGAEQSNTSIVYGEELILKLFRRVSPGINPDLELTRALQEAGSTHVAPVVGWLETDLDGEATTLAVLQEFAASASEGWKLALTSVRDLYAEIDLHADEVGGDFAGESLRLGAATAQVHALLASALPTHVADALECAATAAQMHERLDRAVLDVPALEPFAASLRLTYDAVAALGGGVPTQRVHGDLHLGQVLRTDHGWLMLDFEGEPARPLAERTALMSPLRDVAGMLRSYDYAARSMLTDHQASPALDYRATEWAERNRSGFCDGYAGVAGHDPRDDEILLRAFELDKAVYEVVYEARNRPTWLPIPLGSIARLAG